GSLTKPPCSENTIVYVAAEPIQLGSTAIQLFQEALRIPDMRNSETGDIKISNFIPMSNRDVQPLNGRPVFFYDAEKYCGANPAKRKPPKPEGHYEKMQQTLTQYFYVNGERPSGVPGAYVVSDKEALGPAGQAQP